MAVATIEDEVPHRVPEVTKGRLKLVFILAEFSEIDFEDVEGFDVGEVGKPLERVLVLGFVRRSITQPLHVRRQDFGPFFRNVLAPPFEFRFVLESNVVE